jgi:L-arabinokinase
VTIRLRRLSEIEAAGDVEWFMPALDRLRALREERDERVRDFFAGASPLFVARAPGRLDVMGGIADYSGALVLQLPLRRSTLAVVQQQAAPRCDIATLRAGTWHCVSMDMADLLSGALRDSERLAAYIRGRAIPDNWPAYPLGIVHHCLGELARADEPPAPGLRVLIDSSVPEGKGISSSAALEVAVMTAVAASARLTMAPEALAEACQWVENHVVGAPCGIMDQMTSACGRQDRLLRLRCQPGTIEGHLAIPPGFRFYGVDSGLRHSVSGADYGVVRTAAFMGYRIIADIAGLACALEGARARVRDPQWRGYLTNITPGEYTARFERVLPEQLSGREFLDRYGGITDAVTEVRPERTYPVRQATAHPIHEQQRVEHFAELLDTLPREPRAAVELGQLMYASHESYSACGLGTDGTDRLVQLVAEAGAGHGLFGAKITGGGSGGTVAILGTVQAEGRVRDIAQRYADETGRRAEVFTDSGPGAAQTGVLLVES